MKINSGNTVYIAGPMTGKYLFNYPAFYAMEGLLKKEVNCKVLNPARQPNGLEYEEYMKRAFADLEQADTVILLDGWNESSGAKREVAYAAERGIRIVTAEKVYRAINRKLQKENPTINIKDNAQ